MLSCADGRTRTRVLQTRSCGCNPWNIAHLKWAWLLVVDEALEVYGTYSRMTSPPRAHSRSVIVSHQPFLMECLVLDWRTLGAGLVNPRCTELDINTGRKVETYGRHDELVATSSLVSTRTLLTFRERETVV